MKDSDKLQEKQERAHKLFQQIEEESSGSNIYRGEPELCRKQKKPASSKLYRDCIRRIEGFDKKGKVELVQDAMYKQAKTYATHGKKEQILIELQHFGGSTNLIDFSYDYRVALFFVCRQSQNRKGQLIIVNKDKIEMMNKDKVEKDKIKIIEPKYTHSRITAQKSVLIRHPKGHLEKGEYYLIKIDADLKKFILENLKKYHGIWEKTLFNDLHGFIEHQKVHEDAYTSFYAGLSALEEAKQ